LYNIPIERAVHLFSGKICLWFFRW
jgi:hypothetical protein